MSRGARWALSVLLAMALGLWVDALLGGALAADDAGLAAVGLLALLAGLSARPAALAVAWAGVVLLLAVADQVAEPGRFALANDGVFYAVVVGAPMVLGALIGVRNRGVRELEVRRIELEWRRAVAVRAARAAEVERVEREVDDVLADRLRQMIAGIETASSAGRRRPSDVPIALAAVEATARDALARLRDVLGVLRPEAQLSPPLPAPATSSRRTVVDRVDVLLVLAVVPLGVETSLPGHRGPIWLDVVLAAIQGVALTVVRRRALAGAVLLLAAACSQTAFATALPPTVSWLLPGLLLAFLVGHSPDRLTAWVGLAATVGGVSLLTAVTPAPERAPGGFLPGLALGVLAWLGGRAVAGREARLAELRHIADELTRTRDRAAWLAAAEQRAELARELHDVGAHTLTVVCLQAGAALTWWERDRSQALLALDALDGLATDELSHLCASFGGLAKGGPALPLDVLADLGRALGLRVGVHVEGQARLLDDEVGRVAFRVVQEALTNAARHARRSQVLIGLAYGADALEVQVGDSGPDHDGEAVVPVPGAGLGLRGMRERVEAVRGELSCGPDDDGGFVVHARLPLATPL